MLWLDVDKKKKITRTISSNTRDWNIKNARWQKSRIFCLKYLIIVLMWESYSRTKNWWNLTNPAKDFICFDLNVEIQRLASHLNVVQGF